MYVSEFDLSFESAFEIYGELLAIANYPNEKIELTDTEATINLEETVRDYHIERLPGATAGRREGQVAPGVPGWHAQFRAILKPSDGSAEQKFNFQFKIPNGAKNGATVTVDGGSGCNPFFGGCGRTPDTFDDLLASFEGQPNNVLVAELLTGRKGTVSAHQDTVFDQVITGFRQIAIFSPGQCRPPPGGGGGDEGGFFFFKNAS